MGTPRPPPRPSLPRPEVYRGNGIGLVVAGIATLLLVATLLLPWWTYMGPDPAGNRLEVALFPGTTYSWECDGNNCTHATGTYTYSSNHLTATNMAFSALEGNIGVGVFAGTATFLAAMIGWVDRARSGAVRVTIATSLVAAFLSLSGPLVLALEMPSVLSQDGQTFAPSTFSGGTTSADWGPGAGWLLAVAVAILFLVVAISEWRTLRYAKAWDAPLYEGRPIPSTEPLPVTTPPDRIARLELLRKSGAITDADLTAQKARILAPESLLGPVPIPPNSGSRKAAEAHLRYLRSSGRYSPEQEKAQRGTVLRAYGLSPNSEFPEEELNALVVRWRAGDITQEEFDRRKKEILERI